MAANRLNEGVEQKMARLEEDKNRKAANRKNETNEERDARLEENRNTKAAQKIINNIYLNCGRKTNIDYFEETEDIATINIGHIFEQNQCEFCFAYLWPEESNYSCCNKGKISNILNIMPPPPQVLQDLINNDKHFASNIRNYNNALALASIGTEGPPEMGPSYKIQGKLYHKIGPIGPPPAGEKPKFAQLYFYDTENEAENRNDHVRTNLKFQILQDLQSMLKEVNPYVKSLKNAIEILTTNMEVKICLLAKPKNGQGHQGCYNLPQNSEVAALMPGDQKEDLDIILHYKDGGLQRINANHRSYDPLHYVLLIPGGQDGYHLGNIYFITNYLNFNIFICSNRSY